MHSYDARVASFTAVTKPKSRARPAFPLSSSTHPALTPDNLARAGFYYDPQRSSNTEVDDTCCCFVCGTRLGGWEEGDDPFEEHMKRGSCGWANTVCWVVMERRRAEADGVEWMQVSAKDRESKAEAISLEPESDDALPSGSTMTAYRTDTFGQWWPHKVKRGWKPTIANLAAAGFVYAGTDESNDLVECPLCNYSVEGWEAEDDPLEIHQRKSPDCRFFNAEVKAGPSRPKAATKRNGRKIPASQASKPTSRKSQGDEIVDLASDDGIVVEEKAAPRTRRGPARSTAIAVKSRGKRGAKNETTSEDSDSESVLEQQSVSDEETEERTSSGAAEQNEQDVLPLQERDPTPKPAKARQGRPRAKKTMVAEDQGGEDVKADRTVKSPSSGNALSPTSQPSRLTSKPASNVPAAKAADPPTPLSQLDRLINIPPSSPVATPPRPIATIKALEKPVSRPSPSRLPRDMFDKSITAGAAAARGVIQNLVNSPVLNQVSTANSAEITKDELHLTLTKEQKAMTLEDLVRAEMSQRHEQLREEGETMIARWEEKTRESRKRIEGI